jgi:hypothetical protein
MKPKANFRYLAPVEIFYKKCFIGRQFQYHLKPAGLKTGMLLASILVERRRDKMERELTREIIDILLESSFYFDLTPRERYNLIRHIQEDYHIQVDALPVIRAEGKERSPTA